MAPQENIPVAANVLGTIGTVLWCIQLIPQIYHNWRRKTTEGLPGTMMFLWALCAVPFGVYAVVQNFTIAIQIQPQCFCLFALINWGQILYYNSGWTSARASLVAVFCMVLFGGLEALLILTLRGPYDRGVEWPILLIGVVAAVLLAGGLVPPYVEIWHRRGRVVGFNWVFLGIDWNGALFSLLAIVTQNTFDVLGGVLYILVIVFEGGIFISHLIWLLRTRKLREQAKEAGINFDDMPEAQKYQRKKLAAEEASVNDAGSVSGTRARNSEARIEGWRLGSIKV